KAARQEMRKAIIAIGALGLPTFLLVGCPPSFSDFCTGVAECNLADATLQSDAADSGIDAEPECDPDGAFKLEDLKGITNVPPPWRAPHTYFSPDEKTVYFNGSPDGGQYDLFVPTRDSRSVPFELKNVRIISELSQPDVDEADPVVSDDQRTMIFDRPTQP